MNVRIDEKGIRFRIMPEDLASLLAGGELRRSVSFGSGSFSYRIVPVSSGEDMGLEGDGLGLVLSVSQAALERLRGMGRSKSGITARAGSVEVSLQVDIKVPSHKAA